jgi:hypothetical protein
MLNSPALVLSLAADLPLSKMERPPTYPAPPSYHANASTDSLASGSNVTLDDFAPDTPLPDYDDLPTLEPWLASLRCPHWESSDLALFLPSSDETKPGENGHEDVQMDWAHLRCELTSALIAHDLDADPCSSVSSDHMFDSIPIEVRRWVRDEIPAELQSTALTFACRSMALEPVAFSPMFLDALKRLTEHTLSRTHFDMDHPSTLPTHLPPHLSYLAATLPRAFYRLQLTPLPPADLARLFKALFLLLCRVRFVQVARRRIADREAVLKSAVGRVLLGGHVWGPRWKGKHHHHAQETEAKRQAHHNLESTQAYEGSALGHAFA